MRFARMCHKIEDEKKKNKRYSNKYIKYYNEMHSSIRLRWSNLMHEILICSNVSTIYASIRSFN